METRICTLCDVEKPLNPKTFRQDKKGGSFTRQCISCKQKLHYEWGRVRPQKDMLYKAKQRAKEYGLPFDLTDEDVVIPEFCPILGCKLEQGTRDAHENAPTIDRVIPELGYIKSNIQIISYRANRIKNDATLDELKRLVVFLESLTQQPPLL